MDWNFNYIIPTFIVLVFFLIVYFLKPVLVTRFNKTFLILVICQVLGFLFEVYACHIDAHHTEYTIAFKSLFNNLSLLLFLFRFYLVSVYIALYLHLNVKKDIPTIISAIITLVGIILILSNPLTKFFYTYSEEAKYIRGDNFLLFYVCCIVPVFISFYHLSVYGSKLVRTERVCVLLCLITLFVSCLLKILYEHFLITDSFFIFVLMGLYFTCENPDNLTEKRTGLLNFTAFHEKVSDFIDNKKQFSIITFTIKNYNQKRQILGVKKSEAALREIGNFFLTVTDYHHSYYLRNGNFVVLEKSKKNFKQIKEVVEERFAKPWKVENSHFQVDIITIDMDDDIRFRNFDEISAAFGYSFSDARRNALKYITLTKDILERTIHRANVSIALDHALRHDLLQVYYQPIIDSTTGKVVGAEALVRIHDEKLGLIPPVEFINIAESNGSIELLGQQVLNKVCIFLHKGIAQKLGIKWINVNLSPIQCQNSDIIAQIENIASKNNVDRSLIHLEITEESIIDTDTLKDQMQTLVNDGFKLALDDFGSGFSNVNRVKNYPFSTIKLDMSIVRAHSKEPDGILPSVVKSFKDKGLSITAEGVENEDIAKMLIGMGCNCLQGYLFSKPIPEDEFVEYLKKSNNL